jgi:hypothetical protein
MYREFESEVRLSVVSMLIEGKAVSLELQPGGFLLGLRSFSSRYFSRRLVKSRRSTRSLFYLASSALKSGLLIFYLLVELKSNFN